MKDYLESTGIVLDQVTPKSVIQAAFAAKIIGDGQAWIDMLAHRNLMSHTHDELKFREAAGAVSSRYLGVLESVRDFLKEQSAGS